MPTATTGTIMVLGFVEIMSLVAVAVVVLSVIMVGVLVAGVLVAVTVFELGMIARD